MTFVVLQGALAPAAQRESHPWTPTSAVSFIYHLQLPELLNLVKPSSSIPESGRSPGGHVKLIGPLEGFYKSLMISITNAHMGPLQVFSLPT